MKTLTLAALGALALAGCDFAGADADAAFLPVASIQASGLSIPANAADADGAADVFVEIQNAAGQTIWRSATQTNADVSQTISVSVPEAVEIAARTQGLTVSVWDYDASYTDSQLIARSNEFTADQVAAQSELSIAAGVGSGSFIVSRGSVQQ